MSKTFQIQVASMLTYIDHDPMIITRKNNENLVLLSIVEKNL